MEGLRLTQADGAAMIAFYRREDAVYLGHNELNDFIYTLTRLDD